jgi:F-type H+-transporting ATPase subunit b
MILAGLAELGIHWPSLVVYLVNFVILLAILYVFGYKKILAMLDQRSAKIRDSLAEADRVRQEAVNSQEELTQQLEQGKQEAQQMLEQARQAAERFREEEILRARAESETLIERARQQIQQETDAAVEGIRLHFSELAITAAERVIDRSLDRDAHQDLIEQVLKDDGTNDS